MGVFCLLHAVQIWVFPVCYMLYRYGCFLFVTCCTDNGVCYILCRYGCFLFVTCCTDIGVSCLLYAVQIYGSLLFVNMLLQYRSE